MTFDAITRNAPAFWAIVDYLDFKSIANLAEAYPKKSASLSEYLQRRDESIVFRTPSIRTLKVGRNWTVFRSGDEVTLQVPADGYTTLQKVNLTEKQTEEVVLVEHLPEPLDVISSSHAYSLRPPFGLVESRFRVNTFCRRTGQKVDTQWSPWVVFHNDGEILLSLRRVRAQRNDSLVINVGKGGAVRENFWLRQTGGKLYSRRVLNECTFGHFVFEVDSKRHLRCTKISEGKLQLHCMVQCPKLRRVMSVTKIATYDGFDKGRFIMVYDVASNNVANYCPKYQCAVRLMVIEPTGVELNHLTVEKEVFVNERIYNAFKVHGEIMLATSSIGKLVIYSFKSTSTPQMVLEDGLFCKYAHYTLQAFPSPRGFVTITGFKGSTNQIYSVLLSTQVILDKKFPDLFLLPSLPSEPLSVHESVVYLGNNVYLTTWKETDLMAAFSDDLNILDYNITTYEEPETFFHKVRTTEFRSF